MRCDSGRNSGSARRSIQVGAILAGLSLTAVVAAQPIAHTNQGRNATPPKLINAKPGVRPDSRTLNRWLHEPLDPPAGPRDGGEILLPIVGGGFEPLALPAGAPAGGPGVIPAPSTALPLVGGGLLLLRRRRR